MSDGGGAPTQAPPAFDLAGYLDREREAADRALRRCLEAWRDELPSDVAEAARYGVTGGGKRLRPVLCVAAYRSAGGPGGAEQVHDMAASLELIHAYSLMHDDLPCMDDASLRRSRATTHRVHGVEVTTRAGAALIPMAVLTALRGARTLGCDEETAREVARTLCRAAGAGGMVGGQVLDLLGEGRTLEGAELERLHGMKTGALLTASLGMGAQAAGAPSRVREGVEAYGRAIGLAFQIADDVLDATATREELGKVPSDASLEKSTYVALHGLEGARRKAAAEVDRAHSALDRAGLEAPALRALARFVVERRR